jgi:FAD/FMN-containing dehydrogenase
MQTLTLKTLTGNPICIDRSDLEGAVRAPLVFPESPEYDATRSVWNAMIDRRPAVIIRAGSQSDVSDAVRFAADRSIRFAIRSGGHNIAGNAVCDGGIVIDLRAMNQVHVSPEQRTARVGPGATLAEVDQATQEFGLVVPTGINSTTGIAGLTVGGGFGWTTRKLGLTIDNLRSARLVTADGEVRTVSSEEHPDLFWAIRGGGGNFGVVTEFEFQLHPVGPEVFAGMVVHPLADAASVIEGYQAAVAGASDDLTCWAVLRKAPPLPFIPEKWHGREVLVLAMCYIGDVACGNSATRPAREIGNPVAESVGPIRFTEWQKAFDPLLTEGARNYWKSHDVAEFGSAAVSAIASAVKTLPTDECEIFFGHIGGRATRIATADTAWPNRSAHFALNVHTRWRDRGDDERCIAWARRIYDELTPHAMGSRYVNFIAEGDGGEVRELYGDNFERLASIKAAVDPHNRFRANVNIVPSGCDQSST